MQNQTRIRNINELVHWKKHTESVDRFWGHHTPVGQQRIKYKSKLIEDFIGNRRNIKVLEIGAGNGWYSQAFSKLNWNLVVTDLSPELLKESMKKISNKKVVFRVADAYKLPFKNNSFDAVVGSSVLHHIDLDKALPEIYRVLKPKGKIAFTEPNMLNPQIAVQKNIPYFKKLAGDSPDETAYFSWQMKNILIMHKFLPKTVKPVDFLHPKTPKFLLSPIEMLSRILERIPVIKEVAGSLFIAAIKP